MRDDDNDTPSPSPMLLPPPPNSSNPRSESNSDNLEATIKLTQQMNRLKLNRKSMLYKTQKNQEEIMANGRQSLGDAIIEKIKECKTVCERRPPTCLDIIEAQLKGCEQCTWHLHQQV
jgi:hypothetical protein